MSFEWLWRFAGRAAGPRDGQGLSLEAIDADLSLGSATASTLASAPAPSTAVPGRRDSVEATIAAKLLGAHLANRHQTSFPLTLDFGSLSADEGAMLVDFVAAALAADGIDDAERTRRAGEMLRRVGASAEQVGRLTEGHASIATGGLATAALRHDKAAHAYAVSLLTVGSRSTVGQLYLTYLAARLGLTQQVAGSLNRRFRG